MLSICSLSYYFCWLFCMVEVEHFLLARICYTADYNVLTLRRSSCSSTFVQQTTKFGSESCEPALRTSTMGNTMLGKLDLQTQTYTQ